MHFFAIETEIVWIKAKQKHKAELRGQKGSKNGLCVVAAMCLKFLFPISYSYSYFSV